MIKIQNVHLEKMLSLQSKAGKNYLKNMRVIINNVDAIGALRKELICTLGTEKAKGLLIRYGFTSGYSDAVSIMQDFSLNSKNDSYNLGVLFHTFVGMARVTPVEIHSNEDERNWHCEGIWDDSYEAEYHIKHFDLASEPVCWTLEGYASGIMSAFLGERVIIKEVSCVAKGDPHCTYIGKTLGAWGKEILPDLHYYQEENLNEALELAHAKIPEQNEILKQSLHIHEQLTRMVLNGEDISAIADTVGRIIGGTVIVEDSLFRPLAFFSAPMSIKKNFPTQNSCSAKDIFSNWHHRHLSTTLTQEKRQVLLPAKSSNKPFSRLISPIVIGQDILGYVSTFKISEEFTELNQMILERAALIFALKIMQTRTVVEVENRLKGNFVDDLVSGNFDSDNSIIERASYLGYNISQPHRVLIIDLENFTHIIDQYGQDEKKLLGFKGQLCETVSKLLNGCNRNNMVTAKSNNIIVLTSLDANTTSSEVIDLAKSIQERINRQFPKISVSIGIGRTYHSPKGFSLSYQEAQQSLIVIKGLNQKNTVISFDSLGTYGLLFHAANQKDLLSFMHDQLGKILEYDIKHQTQLVETLNYFFTYDENIKKAARAASITPSGFKYRLGKICEVSDFTLKDPNKRFNLQLALKIWCITKAT
ncbi:MAG: hypothetical protein APF81_12290 [Desulfosporosinus sp. BRH_c37]|nr:MAG: hypothetical protein APF81_12290 [Desulfosporosinus sp. BRH_c37]